MTVPPPFTGVPKSASTVFCYAGAGGGELCAVVFLGLDESLQTIELDDFSYRKLVHCRPSHLSAAHSSDYLFPRYCFIQNASDRGTIELKKERTHHDFCNQ
jgi:hypothetical protein